MRVRYVTSVSLPAGVAVVIAEGPSEAVAMVKADLSLDDALEALTNAVNEYIETSWMFVGGACGKSRGDRMVG